MCISCLLCCSFLEVFFRLQTVPPLWVPLVGRAGSPPDSKVLTDLSSKHWPVSVSRTAVREISLPASGNILETTERERERD